MQLTKNGKWYHQTRGKVFTSFTQEEIISCEDKRKFIRTVLYCIVYYGNAQLCTVISTLI